MVGLQPFRCLSRDGFFDWPLEGLLEWVGGNNGDLYGKKWEVYGIIKKDTGINRNPAEFWTKYAEMQREVTW